MKIRESHSLQTLLAALLGVLILGQAEAQESYIIFDNQTGQILESEKPNEKLQVASLTKIATCMVVLDWANLHQVDISAQVPMSNAAFTNGASSSVGLMPGDSVSLRDLMYCALLASDNVAANALADHVGSRIPNPDGLDAIGNFVAQMNALGRTLFMKRTLFLNPSGMDNLPKGHALPHSTAEDIARLTRHAYDDAAFKFYVAQKKRAIHVLRNGVDYPIEITNTTELLGQDDIDGVKTGRTRRAGDCLILSADRSPESHREGETVMVTPRRISVVLLGSTDRFRDGLGLLRHGWALYDSWASEGRPTKKGSTL
ncbi:MAG: D-alanyl-D-alanine carboxypeptidase family protein [Spartobacteria bacterium]